MPTSQEPHEGRVSKHPQSYIEQYWEHSKSSRNMTCHFSITVLMMTAHERFYSVELCLLPLLGIRLPSVPKGGRSPAGGPPAPIPASSPPGPRRNCSGNQETTAGAGTSRDDSSKEGCVTPSPRAATSKLGPVTCLGMGFPSGPPFHSSHSYCDIQSDFLSGTSLVIQGLGLRACTPGGLGLIPGQGTSLEAQRVKRLPTMRETWVQSLG